MEATTEEKPKLSKAEASALRRLQQKGLRLLRPGQALSQSDRSLVEKGFARELPGLLGDPQGIAPID